MIFSPPPGMAQKRCSMDAFTESELDVLRAPKEWRRELDLQTGDDEAMDVEVEAMDAGVQFGIDSSSSARPPTSSRSLTPGDGCEFATYSGFPECGGPGFPPHFQGTSVNGHVHFCFVCGYRKVKKTWRCASVAPNGYWAWGHCCSWCDEELRPRLVSSSFGRKKASKPRPLRAYDCAVETMKQVV